MKGRFLITILLLTGLLKNGFAQGNFEGGLYAEHYQLGYRAQLNFGIIVHAPLGDRFTLNYQIGLGPKLGGGLYVHAPVGAVAGAFLLANANDFDFLSTVGILTLLVPEGVGMYFGEGKMKMHASVNPLGFDYWHRRDPNYEEIPKVSGSLVFRVKMNTGMEWPSFIAPQVAGTMIYTPGESTSRFGVRAGITIGIGSTE